MLIFFERKRKNPNMLDSLNRISLIYKVRFDPTINDAQLPLIN